MIIIQGALQEECKYLSEGMLFYYVRVLGSTCLCHLKDLEKNHWRFLIGVVSYNSYCLQRKLRVISWRDNVFVQQNCFFWLDREYVDLQNRV